MIEDRGSGSGDRVARGFSQPPYRRPIFSIFFVFLKIFIILRYVNVFYDFHVNIFIFVINFIFLVNLLL